MIPEIRFDSLDPSREGRSIQFAELLAEIEARRPEEVVPALARVERLVKAGAHAAGFIAYEAAPGLDPSLAAYPGGDGLPLLWFGLFRNRSETPALAGLEPADGYRIGDRTPSISQGRYRAAIAQILELIAAGDTYQVNFTFRLAAPFDGSDLALYRDLCLSQRSAFCALVRFPRFSVISASPELFFHRTGDRVEVRPMKGTRPRGRWSAEDDALADALRNSLKDRAENLMIVDLLRNDLGRVCTFGSIDVPSLFEVESYPTVHQMTSTVAGQLRPGTSVVDLFRALFPSGSVTGAPKIRTSEIIRGLEDSPRGVYTGAIGFISAREAVFSVAIRTAVVDRQAGRLELGVGSGITADSVAEVEYRECLEKGAFLTRRLPEFQLLESLRLEISGGYPLLEGHLSRLGRSARYFGFRYDPEGVREALNRFAQTTRDGLFKVRLLMDREGRVELSGEAIPTLLAPARVGIASAPVDPADPLLYHKTTERTPYLSRRAERADCEQVILVNTRGEITETDVANIVLDVDGELVTPPLESGLLPGVLRERVLEAGTVRTRVLTPGDLERARRIYLLNAVRGWREGILVSSPLVQAGR